MKVTRTFWAVVIIVFASLFAGFMVNQSALFFPVIYLRVALIAGLFIIVDGVLAALSSRQNSLDRFQRFLRLQVGQVFEERFEYKNNSSFGKIWTQIMDECKIPNKNGSKVITNIGRHQERGYISRTLLTKRGAFLLGPTHIITGDPFGLFRFDEEISPTKTLIVLPYMVELIRFLDPPGFLPGGRALHLKSLEVTAHASGIREYAPGDPLNRIHWKSTARRNKYMVKEFEQDPQSDLWIMLDAERSSHIQGEESDFSREIDPLWLWTRKKEFKLPKDSFEYGVSAAASIANYYIKVGKAVGVASAGETTTVLPVEKGERQLGKILENLAFLKPDGKLPLHGLIEMQIGQIARGSTVVLTTASVFNTISIAINELLTRKLNPIVILIDQVSFGGSEDSGQTIRFLEENGISYVLIRNGDDLKEKLQGIVKYYPMDKYLPLSIAG